MRFTPLTVALTSLFVLPNIHFHPSTHHSPLCFSFPSLIAPTTSSPSTTNYNSPSDVVLTIKHQLGRIKSSYESESYAQSLDLITNAEQVFREWKIHIQKTIQQRDAPEIINAVGDTVIPEPAEFHIKVTHVPKRVCTRKTAVGSTLKVHFVGKLLKDGKKGKAFDSSFHTGSMPYKFVLGSDGGAKVEGWNKGLVGMCQGERRSLVVPYTLGYGEKGIPGKVPPYSNLKYMIELVEFTGGKRNELWWLLWRLLGGVGWGWDSLVCFKEGESQQMIIFIEKLGPEHR